MRGGKQKQGYTIVEVMIFLLISGFMFIIAAGFINGKQARAEFRQGMNDINSQVQQAINDVSNGFYPSLGDFKCSAGSNLGDTPTFPNAALPTGTNKGCTFVGKVVQFDVNNATGSNYNIYSVIGRQFQTDDKSLLPPTSFRELQPVAMTGIGNTKDLTDRKTLAWGLQVYAMFDRTTPIGAFGIFSGLPGTTTDSNTGDTHLDSGATAPMAVAIPGSQRGQDVTDIDSQVRSMGSVATTIDTDPNIIVCFRGRDNLFGRLTIGGSDNVTNQKLTSHIQITTNAPAAGCPVPA